MPQLGSHRPTTKADIREVINNIRPEDEAEIRGLGHSPLGLFLSVELSDHAVTLVTPDGVVAGLTGVVNYGDRAGEIWMVCTPAVEKYPLALVKQARKWLKEIGKDYDHFYNMVDKDNEGHKRLLRHLGFKGLRYVQPPPYYKPYIEFVKLCAYPS